MEFDPEIKAMHDCFETLKGLDEKARARVLFWLNRKFLSGDQKVLSMGSGESTVEQVGLKYNFDSFSSIAEVFGHVNLKTDYDKVLIVSVYLQTKEQKTELTSREISKELNHLGHGVSNITNAIGALIKRKPNLMIQTRKEGTSQQAQKKYKVTVEGIKVALNMLNDVIESQSD